MVFDYNELRAHTPKLQPKILGDYKNPGEARTKLEEEAKKYACGLMKKWGAKLQTPSGLKTLDEFLKNSPQ